MDAIAAMSRNRVIGYKNKLPWHYTEDMKFFRKMTIGKKIVMGRNTFDSVGALPNRHTFVLTNKPNKELKEMAKEGKIRIIKKLTSIPKDAMICGGAKLYSETLEMCSNVYLTYIDKDYKGDIYMPLFEIDANFILKKSIPYVTSDGTRLEFRHYSNRILNGN